MINSTDAIPNKDDYNLVPYAPVWGPFNAVSVRLCSELTDRIMTHSGLADRPSSRAKMMIASASALYQMQLVKKKHALRKDCFLGVVMKASAWSRYPAVGRVLGIRVLKALESFGVLTQVPNSGSSNLRNDKETGYLKSTKLMTLYVVNLDLLPNDLDECRFVQEHLPLVKVNTLETRPQRDLRKKRKLSTPSLSIKKCKDEFGDSFNKQQRRIESLNSYLRKHPLVLPEGHAAASVTRVFHDGSLTSGGRLYGRHTTRDSKLRIESQIDGEDICQIDIRASQPILLSFLLGEPINNVAENGRFWDVYIQLTNLWSYGQGTTEEFTKRARGMAKGFIMEIIGTGNINKNNPSKKLKQKWSVTNDEWNLFRERLIYILPALKRLAPRYASNGQVTGYINGAGFLSFHESEIMLITLERLMGLNVPAYPVHDCLIVKKSGAKVAIETFRSSISDYVQKLTGNTNTLIIAPLTMETKETKIPQYPFNGDYLGGTYRLS